MEVEVVPGALCGWLYAGACRLICWPASHPPLAFYPLLQERYPNNPRVMRAYSRFLQQVGWLREACLQVLGKQLAPACRPTVSESTAALLCPALYAHHISLLPHSWPGQERPARLSALRQLCRPHRADAGGRQRRAVESAVERCLLCERSWT